jgi:hypothetical protein
LQSGGKSSSLKLCFVIIALIAGAFAMRRPLIVLLLCILLPIPVSAHTESAPPSSEEALAGWIALIGAALLAGTQLFTQAVVPAIDARRSQIAQPLHNAGWIGWGLMGLALMLGLTARSLLVILPPSRTLTEPGVQAATGMQYGLNWLVCLILWLASGAALLRRWLLALYLLTPTLLLMMIVGVHPPSPEDTLASLGQSWTYQLAIMLWIGGLFGFALTSTSARQRRSVIQRSGLYISGAVALLALAIVWGDALRVASLADLASLEGQRVILKAALFAPVLIMAAVTARTRQIALPLLLLMAIALAGGLLIDSQTAPPPGAEIQPIFVDQRQTNALVVELQVAPAQAGRNRIDLILFERQTGLRVDDMEIEAEISEAGAAAQSLRLDALGDGVYSIDHDLAAGRWALTLAINGQGLSDTANFLLPITVRPVAPLWIDPPGWVAPLAALLFVIMAALGTAAWRMVKKYA